MLSKSGDAHVARIGEIFGNENFQCYWGLGVQGQGDELGHLFSKEMSSSFFVFQHKFFLTPPAVKQNKPPSLPPLP